MSMPQPVRPFEAHSPTQVEESTNLVPLYGPLPVAETTDSTVVAQGEMASVDRNENSGDLYFCLREPAASQNRVEAPVRGPAGGPWASSGLVQIGEQEYQLQVSLMFATSPRRQRLYGILVPVVAVAAKGSEYGDAEEEPIVVWGSEDEGEGPTAMPES